jgi:hypothetical protein
MSFRLNKTWNKKLPSRPEDLLDASPFLKGIHTRKQGLGTLRQGFKENNAYLVSSGAGRLALTIIAVGSLITYASFRFSLMKNPELVQTRRNDDKQREREEGKFLLSQVSKP